LSKTGGSDEDDDMTGGSEVVKSGGCMGSGAVDDDREDVEVNED
jgi:hypothetical protein